LVSRRPASPFYRLAAWANAISTFWTFVAGAGPLNGAQSGSAGYLYAYREPYAKANIFAALPDPGAERNRLCHCQTHVDAIADQNQEANEDGYTDADGHLYAHPHSYPYTDFHPNATAHTRRGLSRGSGAHLDVPLHL
jgi:hypothetical protein